jgi:superfamily II DNA or RNA helicase
MVETLSRGAVQPQAVKTDREAAELRARLLVLDRERQELKKRLVELTSASSADTSLHGSKQIAGRAAQVVNTSPVAAKVALFRRLFAGRTDVYPLRWENVPAQKSGYAPACANEWRRGICGKPQLKCTECPNQAFIPVSDEMIGSHLRGEARAGGRTVPFVAGVYPLLADETCWFLALDFDGESWSRDALAFMETCGARNVPASLEQSRSGQGGHVWIFFSEPVAARDARQLGALLLTATLERRPEVGFDSYDRLFPSQDTLPKGGLGNLIALPLQRQARDFGNSVFVDKELRPFEDQWAALSSITRMSGVAVRELVSEAEAHGRVLGVRIPEAESDVEEPWRMLPSRRTPEAPITGPLPSRVQLVLADEVYIDRSALPPLLITRLARLAAFQNPEFYRAQAMRLPTHGKPRIICCASLEPKYVVLPRGCLDEAVALLESNKIHVELEDHRERGVDVPVRFLGTLREEQWRAAEALRTHDFGVLAATTAFGKTVVAASLIAERSCSTLILVHRRELLGQWTERLKQFLSLSKDDLGVIGGGKRKPSGRIDVAVIQSLVRKGEVSDLVAGYGQLIVDECHHLSARSFEQVARRSKARFVLGLSATVARKDGHQPIIFMQCGSVRYRVNAKEQAERHGFEHRVQVRATDFQLPAQLQGQERVPMSELYAALAADEARNALIFDDVLTALEAGRYPLVLTERRDHLEALRARFEKFAKNIVVLRGGMGSRERRAAEEVLRVPEPEERLVLSTGRFLGEGFDDSRLDTLFLVSPISWKGTLAQYVGRLHREHEGKGEVRVYDYVDVNVPVLARMAAKRRAGYRALGYTIE